MKTIGVAIVVWEGRTLVGVRGAGGPLPGKAEFPGGKCLPEETPVDCAVRECLEETGLAVRPVESLARTRFDYPHGAVDLHFWRCEPVDPAAVREVHQGFRWIALPDLPTLDFPEANRDVVERLAARP